jgi:hypothetical protein
MGFKVVCVDIRNNNNADELAAEVAAGAEIVATVYGHNPHNVEPAIICLLQTSEAAENEPEAPRRGRRKAGPSEVKETEGPES